MERWRKPLTVLDVEETRTGTKVTFDRDSTERIRSGYACAKCLEVFEQSWPLHCPTCGAPIRARQLEFFQREYGGYERLGPKASLSEEFEGLEERRRKEEEHDPTPG